MLGIVADVAVGLLEWSLKPVSNRTVVLGDEPRVVSLAAAAETDELK